MKITKTIILLLSTLFIIGCNKSDIPKELVGQWSFDVDKAREAIKKSERSSEEKKMLEEAFLSLVQNQTLTISSSGKVSMSGVPSAVKLTLEVVKKDGDKYYFKTTNSMNPSNPQYSLDYLTQTTWHTIEVDENLKPLNRAPDTYWTKEQ